MRRKRAGAARLSDHAFQRWKLRVGPASKNSVADRIGHRIATELRLGAEVNRNGALEIEVMPKAMPGIWAICYPSLWGGWVVATIIREGWEKDMEERERYESEAGACGAKYDADKPRLTLVPPEVVRCIAAVREYGVQKYGSAENWRTVEKERYRDALYRHLLEYLEDPAGVDRESGLPTLWHIACNVAFLCELEHAV